MLYSKKGYLTNKRETDNNQKKDSNKRVSKEIKRKKKSQYDSEAQHVDLAKYNLDAPECYKTLNIQRVNTDQRADIDQITE